MLDGRLVTDGPAWTAGRKPVIRGSHRRLLPLSPEAASRPTKARDATLCEEPRIRRCSGKDHAHSAG
eukprot:scaffold2570_cov436-Prasinococcus_capsulatus_cf.AAC.3